MPYSTSLTADGTQDVLLYTCATLLEAAWDLKGQTQKEGHILEVVLTVQDGWAALQNSSS
jgi:hypothetical protein